MAESSRANGRLARTESAESRWVSRVLDEEDEEEVVRRGGRLDLEEEDDGEQRLIRTGPRIDWFDVEALEVTGAQRNENEEFDLGRTAFLALQTLGFVFGDVGTSPLYTFDVMFNKCPIRGEEDVIGALSLVLYTLILIPLVKYVLVVLWSNDDGEGGTFALYSLICRKAKVSLLPNQLPSDARISSFQLKAPSPELERSIKVKQQLESSEFLKELLLVLVLFGTSMVIADGVVTPAMSVISAVSGLKVRIPNFTEDKVVMISVAFLVILFSLQRYATSKMGLAVGPALFIWFCSLGGIGIYNLVKYETTVLKAFSPAHIYYYFKRNSSQAWLSLGGCLLCVTGSEAMFADLCHFSVRSIQLSFLFLVLPCLLLAYLGQAAFLVANSTSAEQIFFLSLPSGTFWPVLLIASIAALIASRTMTTATFSCIKQSIALGCFPRLKIIHTSRKFMGQIYIPVVNWFLLLFSLAFLASFGSINELGNAYGIAEIGVMLTTTILVTVIMLLIWQTNILIVLCFVTTFMSLELIFFSSVLGSVGDGSWVLLVFTAVLFTIMYIWNYGSKLKYDSEVKQRLSMDLMMKLGCNLGTVRAPGIGLVYNELVKGIPAVFGQFLTTFPAVHSMIVFVCIKSVPVPVVPQDERFLFRRLCPRSYHMFRCIARYGYKDIRKENHKIFEQLLIDSLEKFIRREALEYSLESDSDGDLDAEAARLRSRIVVAPNGSCYSLDIPLLADCITSPRHSAEASTSSHEPPEEATPDYTKNLEMELSFIRKVKESGVVYLLENGSIRARKDSWFFKKLVINYFYAFLRKNCRRSITTMNVPHTNLMQVHRTYMV
ncbi:potassium transporter 7-like isoform X1 [Typha latifolia]|uniref:potassium transporter 7-like isoform X1 n=2 Tax=Typha latifolia TaxID=4733 RepID=UPI003C2E87C2